MCGKSLSTFILRLSIRISRLQRFNNLIIIRGTLKMCIKPHTIYLQIFNYFSKVNLPQNCTFCVNCHSKVYYCVLITLLLGLHACHEVNIDIVLVFVLLLRLCETHSVTIYGGGTAIDPIVNSLCGFRDRENINYSSGNKLLVEFR